MGNKPSRHHEQEEKKETVFKSQKNEVYRIPALFYDREKKVLLAFAEKRRTSNDAHAEELVMKTGTMRNKTTHNVKIKWSTPSTIVTKADLGGYRPMNPCPVYEKTNKTLFLFFICVEGTVSEQWQIDNCINKTRLCYITSQDLGQSWSGVTNLTDKLDKIKCWATFAVGPGHGLQTESGRLIVPVYAYASCCNSCCCSRSKSKKPTPYALALYRDESTDWQFGKMLQNESLECEMAEFVDDTQQHKSFIYCNARSKRGYRVEALETKDGFNILPSTEKLVETRGGCQGSVVSFPAQTEPPSQGPNKWLLYTHPSVKDKRTKLGVYLNKSPSNPNAWSEPWIINSGPSAYSDLAYIDDGWFACLMECGIQKYTEQIALKVFSYKEIKPGNRE